MRSRSLFGELRSNGRRVTSGPVRMTFLALETAHPQVAFAFGRRFGNAVERNRARRRLTAAFVEARRVDDRLIGSFQISGTRALLNADFASLVSACGRCFDQLANAGTAAGRT